MVALYSMAETMPVPVTSTHDLQCLSYCRQNEWHNQVSLDAGEDSCSQSTFLQTKHIPSCCHTVSDHLRIQNARKLSKYFIDIYLEQNKPSHSFQDISPGSMECCL